MIMEYSRFLWIMLSLQKEDRIVKKAYDIGVDMINFLDPYHRILSTLILEIYGEDAHGWWDWYCYENNFGQGGLSATDEDGNPICYSWGSLYEQMELCKVDNSITNDG